MGEEKKPKGEKKPKEKKPKDETKAETVKKETEEKAVSEAKPKEEVKKSEVGDGKKDSKAEPSPPPPPPPPEIVLSVFMHCEGCARKVRRCLKGFEGVEDVTTDCKTHKVVVKGEKADPLKVLDRLQKKINRQVELLSPIPKPPVVEEAKKPEVKEPPKPEEKKEEPKVITVVLNVNMHCEACSMEIKRRIERMKEVEEAIPDLKNLQVTVKGTFDPPKLVEHVHKRTGKHATILKQDPPLEKKEDDKAKTANDEKKDEKSVKGKGKKGEEKKEEAKEEQKEVVKVSAEGGDGKATAGEAGAVATAEEGAKKAVESKISEFQYYPPRYAMEMYSYPPQIFSDENPNACSIM